MRERKCNICQTMLDLIHNIMATTIPSILLQIIRYRNFFPMYTERNGIPLCILTTFFLVIQLFMTFRLVLYPGSTKACRDSLIHWFYFFGCIPRSGIAGPCGSSDFSFGGTPPHTHTEYASFLKVTWDVGSETIARNFSCSFMLKKKNHLFCTLTESFIIEWFSNIVLWSFERYWHMVLCKSSKMLTQ